MRPPPALAVLLLLFVVDDSEVCVVLAGLVVLPSRKCLVSSCRVRGVGRTREPVQHSQLHVASRTAVGWSWCSNRSYHHCSGAQQAVVCARRVCVLSGGHCVRAPWDRFAPCSTALRHYSTNAYF
jgi:hypothetical protein